MIVHQNGSYEYAEWHTPEFAASAYPDSFYVDESTEEGAALAEKIAGLRYFNLVVVDGVLTDVVERVPTPEEEAATQPQKTPEQLRIEQLESDNLALMTALADVYEQLLALQTGGTA